MRDDESSATLPAHDGHSSPSHLRHKPLVVFPTDRGKERAHSVVHAAEPCRSSLIGRRASRAMIPGQHATLTPSRAVSMPAWGWMALSSSHAIGSISALRTAAHIPSAPLHAAAIAYP